MLVFITYFFHRTAKCNKITAFGLFQVLRQNSEKVAWALVREQAHSLCKRGLEFWVYNQSTNHTSGVWLVEQWSVVVSQWHAVVSSVCRTVCRLVDWIREQWWSPWQLLWLLCSSLSTLSSVEWSFISWRRTMRRQWDTMSPADWPRFSVLSRVHCQCVSACDCVGYVLRCARNSSKV